jgi:two-component system, NtrC family, response regulator AlgB
MMARVLIVDDDSAIRSHLATYLADVGHDAEAAGDAITALALMERSEFDAVLSDVRMAGMDGFTLLREIRRRWPEAGFVLMTAYATVPDAVEAIRGGAHDYLVKPFSLEQVGLVLGRLLEVQGLRRENRTLRRAVDAPPLLESRNPGMQHILATARRAAAADSTILLTGESGVGKNIIAAAIHRWSPRSGRPFVTIACTTLAEHLLESELFGHVRGAFTGAWRDKPGRLEAAEGGTAFLDEVGELPAELQAKLLRFLEERRFERVGSSDTITVGTRIIAATSRDLAGEVRAGRFREDLFYRLNVIGLRLPALRERREDLPALTDHILTTLAVRHGRPGLTLTPEARRAIEKYAWPGNVRELVNALERAVVLAGTDTLDAESLPDQVVAPAAGLPALPLDAGQTSLEDVERLHVQRVLAESATLEEAALRLGINPTTLWRKRKRWGIE